jgi:hypothetical protein
LSCAIARLIAASRASSARRRAAARRLFVAVPPRLLLLLLLPLLPLRLPLLELRPLDEERLLLRLADGRFFAAAIAFGVRDDPRKPISVIIAKTVFLPTRRIQLLLQNCLKFIIRICPPQRASNALNSLLGTYQLNRRGIKREHLLSASFPSNCAESNTDLSRFRCFSGFAPLPEQPPI